MILYINIYWTHYLFSDWPKSVPVTSSRLYNNHAKYNEGHVKSCHLRPRCVICKGNHVKFARFALLAVRKTLALSDKPYLALIILDIIKSSSHNILLFYFKVELLLEIEESLPQWILRRVQVDKYEEFPNRKSKLQTKVRILPGIY